MTANPDRNVLPMSPKPTPPAFVSVDSATAKRWLAGNKVNRSLRVAKVNQYANDMRSGRWTISNDALCFAPDGTLLNGQHRLHAVIKSGTSVVMLVMRNVPPAAMGNMDINASRTAADALKLNHEKSTHLLAAGAKLSLICHDGRIYKDTKTQAVSPSEIQEFIEENPLIRHSVAVVQNVRNKIDAAPSVLVAAHWIIANGTGETAPADIYLQQLASRTGEPEGSAVLAVDSRLRQLRYKRSQFAPRAYLSLLLKGWNHYARDNRVAVLTISSAARIPDPTRWQR